MLFVFIYIVIGQSSVAAGTKQPVVKPTTQHSPVTVSQRHSTTSSDGT